VTAALALLQRQGTGGAGFLQTNGYANIFYARDKKGALCAIRLGWADDGWVMDAISVQDPFGLEWQTRNILSALRRGAQLKRGIRPGARQPAHAVNKKPLPFFAGGVE